MAAMKLRVVAFFALPAAIFACVPVPPGLPPKDPEPVSVPTQSSEPSPEERAKIRQEAQARKQKNDVDAAVQQPSDGKDPLKGVFTMAEATINLPGPGKLLATIDTSMGKIECRLLDDRAPNTVANFIGLANGLRPYKSREGKWVRSPYYDNTGFHRIIKGFMIQGDDQNGNGTGEPGYVIPDEMWSGAKHDKAGLLCMANRGPNTNGAQFFITDAPAAWLDQSYTIFGVCQPTSTVHAIANSPKDASDKPQSPISIDRVIVTREGS